jgi:hypothetical protein
VADMNRSEPYHLKMPLREAQLIPLLFPDPFAVHPNFPVSILQILSIKLDSGPFSSRQKGKG